MATSASSAAGKALDRAKSFLGYRETPARSNRTRFGKQYGWDGVAWCVIFVWCILQDTGSTAGVLKTASTGAMERWGKSVGRAVTTPRAGDLIILRNSRGATIHTEFVYSYSGGRLLGLGGNTSGGAGSVADGGTVAINDRTSLWKRGRIRFVRPFYGVTVEDVKTVQKAAGIAQDGVIGPKTVAATKTLQRAAGIPADGFPGPATIGAITGEKVADAGHAAAGKTPKPPAFPLPAGYYYGPASGPKQSVSGKTANSAVPRDVTHDAHGKYRSIGLYAWQKQMKARGWKIDVDGKFGPETEKIVRQFQRNKGLGVDGKLGPKTWAAAWTEPVR